ncbi:MAG: cobalamin B12-binding domain-containing protein, partial [Actinomycetota bacterium]|nr:cobalamin B12-binding domain-containing protein [Actinomycetota bacterium]
HALSRGWDRGLGPRALLACAPGELHDLGLVTFGLALRARGWRIGYLGADTPVESTTDAARAFVPAFVVVSAVTPERFQDSDRDLRRFARRHKLGLGGAGAADARIGGAVTLSGDAIAEAEHLTELVRARA